MPRASRRWPRMPTLVRLWLLAAMALNVASGLDFARAQDEKPVAPSKSAKKLPRPLTKYKGREIAQTMHYTGATWLMRDSRQREEDCETMLEVFDAQPGQVICDMGCGNGFYTLPIAKSVGEKGRVYAVDIQPEMLTMLNERVKAEGLKNVTPLLGTPVDPLLPEGEVDMILAVDVYHEFSNPVQMLQAMHRALKPDGRLVLVEFRKEDDWVPIKVEHKMTKKQVLKELEPNGFELAEEFEELPWQHMLFFKPIEKKTPGAKKNDPSAKKPPETEGEPEDGESDDGDEPDDDGSDEDAETNAPEDDDPPTAGADTGS